MQFTVGIENFSFRIRTFLVWHFHLEYNYQEMSYLIFFSVKLRTRLYSYSKSIVLLSYKKVWYMQPLL